MLEKSTQVDLRKDIQPDLPPLILKLLSGRGYKTPEEIRSWVYPTLKDLRPPDRLKDIDIACTRLLRARQDQETVAIYGDYDLDGTSGVALFKRALSDLGFKNILHHQPLRLKDGYGLHPKACETLAKEGQAKIILTVDVGITGHEAAKRCRELGVDLIITDHHLPEKGRPDALAVINPNQEDCSSGLGHLCGAGVAFYLCLALLARMRRTDPHLRVDPKSWLDVFTIATITDMVPLIAENRVLVKHGLKALQNTARAPLKELLCELNLLEGPLSAQDVAIRFAPKLNALSRMEGELRPLDLYLETDPLETFDLVQKVLIVNEERRRLQKNAEEIALSACEKLKTQRFLWCFDREIHPGVLGLAATKLAQQLGRPSFVGSLSECGEFIVGSARRPDSHAHVNLVEALSSAQNFLVKFGGHAPAAGFELRAENADLFAQSLKDFFDGLPAPKIMESSWSYDLEVTLKDLDTSLMTWLEHLEPFGVGFPVPLFKICSVEVAKVKELKGEHLRLTLLDGVKSMNAIWFSPPPEISCKLKAASFLKADVLGELTVNRFRGNTSLQVMVRDLKV